MKYLKYLILAMVAIWAAVWVIPDDRLHVVFCDVGQGDAILITWRNQQILVDGGPGKEVVNCLAKHIPFYDRTIEVVILTHKNSDHENGLKYVIERYNVMQYEPALRREEMVVMGQVKFRVVWPDDKVLGANTIGIENDQGIVGEVKFGNFEVLLTGDVQTKMYLPPDKVEIVKVPHHGSKYGWDPDWWAQARPEVAVISVGKNNTYGHPAEEVLRVLRELDIKILRTDEDGEVEIVSDGVKWWVNENRN